jgi:hypothetical protein
MILALKVNEPCPIIVARPQLTVMAAIDKQIKEWRLSVLTCSNNYHKAKNFLFPQQQGRSVSEVLVQPDFLSRSVHLRRN